MPEETDFWRHVKEVAREAAIELLQVPTGVTPGFHAQSGLTIGRYGEVLFAGSPSAASVPTAGLVVLLNRGTVAAASIANGVTKRAPMGTALYDPGSAFAAGTAWLITLPADTFYRAEVGVAVRGTSTAYTVGSFYDMYVNVASNATIGLIAYEQIEPGNYSPYMYMTGALYFQGTAGEQIYLAVENQGGAGATAPASSEDFFALSYAVAAQVPAEDAVEVLLVRQHLTGASSTLTISDGATLQVNYNITDTDIGSAMSGSTFTAGAAMDVVIAGAYAFSGSVTLEAGFPGVSAGVYKNDALVDGAGSFFIEHAYASGFSFSGRSAAVTVGIGDTIKLKLHNFSGQTLTFVTTGSNTWSITQV